MALSSPISFLTKIPFPQPEVKPVRSNETQPEGTLAINTCSEFTKYHTFVDYFKKSGKLRLIHDLTGKPLVFVINNDNELCALRLGAHECEGWSSMNITPKGFSVITYDVLVAGAQLMIALACRDSKNAADGDRVFFRSIDMSSLTPALSSLEKKDDKEQAWQMASDNTKDPLGKLVAQSILCTITGPFGHPDTKFQIVLGTEAADHKIATLYTVDPSAQAGEVWSRMTYPAAASSVVQVEPLLLGQTLNPVRETGLLSRFVDFATNGKQNRLAGHVYAKGGGIVRTFEMKTAKLGEVRCAFSHLNPWGLTDIFVSGVKGIGFYSFEAIDVLACEPVIPEKSFQQVVASEAADPDKPTEQSKIAVFAISDDHSLYYIEGTRNFQTRVVSFKCSGLPIRDGVSQLSCMYNASHGTSELLYTCSDADTVKLLRRNPAGNLWLEDDITSKGKRSISYDALVTTISLYNSATKAPAITFPVKISSENLHVVANGTSYVLGQQATKLYSDFNGCITVVIPSKKELGCPVLNVLLDSNTPEAGQAATFTCQIEPSGRIDRLLGSIRTADDLKGAKSTANTLPFKDLQSDTLQNAADVLGKYKDAKDALVSNSGANANGKHSSSIIMMGDVNSEVPGFWSSVEDAAVEFLGEALEVLKKTIKTVVKVVIRVVGPVVRVLFKLFGKWISFQLKTLYNLLSAVGNVLKDVFGWDGLNKLLEYCRLALDPLTVLSTQKVLKQVVMGSIDLTGRIFDANRSSVSHLFDDATTYLEQFIDDPRRPPKEPAAPGIMQRIHDILNNPFVKLLLKINPMAWIMEAIMEEVPGIQVPSLAPALDSILAQLDSSAMKQVEILDKAMNTFYTQLQGITNDPSQFLDGMKKALQTVFWTLFDSLRNFVEGVYGIITAVINAIGTVLDGVWKIPGVTDLWVDLTEQEFTLLGFMTYGPAVFLNLLSFGAAGKLPFENVQMFDFQSVEVKPLYVSKNQNRSKEKSQTVHARNPTTATTTSNTASMPSFESMSSNFMQLSSVNIEREVAFQPVSTKALNSPLSSKQANVLQAGFGGFGGMHWPQMSSSMLDMVKNIIAMIKYFAFAADNGYSIWQTIQQVQPGEVNPDSWLDLLKLAGNFISSIMLLLQGLPGADEPMTFGHGAAFALGMGGVGCASYAMVMTRKGAMPVTGGKEGDFERVQQMATARISQEASRWLGWIGTAIYILQTEAPHQALPLTIAQVASPLLSGASAAAQYFNVQNAANPYAAAALYAALVLSMLNNLGLSGYHGYQAITGP